MTDAGTLQINDWPNRLFLDIRRASQVALVVKNPPANAGDIKDVTSIPESRRTSLEEGMATHSSILAWRIPWTEEPGAGYSP